MGINDILAAIDNMKRVGGRNIRDLGRDPIGALSKIAHNVKEQLGTEEGAKEFMYNSMAPGVGGIIKGKGGNWLTGSVENALSGLKRGGREAHTSKGMIDHPTDPSMFIHPETGEIIPKQAVLGNQAVNNWIEGPLTKYVKRDMATEGDPVRKLAEQGVLHIRPEMTRLQDLSDYRKMTGFEKQPVLTRPESQYWNNMADSVVDSRTVNPAQISKTATYGSFNLVDNPWLEKLEPGTDVYHMAEPRGNIPEMLGFNHLTDELSNALNPESGLPRHLQLTPEQMQQLGMEKAVRHVADINAWRAAQQAEANLAKSQSPAVHMVREYAENNPKGLKWVEIKPPKVESDLPYGAAGDPAAEARRHLADQLKYEGDTMGHCVGGYCDDVASGKSRIFSLRDAKGEPHVTIETTPGDVARRLRQLPDEERYALAQEIKDKHFGGVMPGRSDEDRYFKMIDDAFLEKSGGSLPFDIKQIKGKQNRKPNDEYLPFVQDFVKNHPEGGQWGDIGDLQNTGLRRAHDAFNANERMIYENAGHNVNGYMTQQEIDALGGDTFDQALQLWREKKPLQNFAEGGIVQGNYQPVEFDGVTGYILR